MHYERVQLVLEMLRERGKVIVASETPGIYIVDGKEMTVEEMGHLAFQPLHATPNT